MTKVVSEAQRAFPLLDSAPRNRSLDTLVGERLRLRRRILRISQEQLGAEIGVSPQQIHKYETGQSRLSTTRLLEISVTLEVPVAWFFDGLCRGNGAAQATTRGEDRELLVAFGRISSKPRRRKLLEIARLLADECEQV